MNVIKDDSMLIPIKIWDGAGIDDNCIEQLKGVSKLPFVSGISLMADGHLGIGCSVGSVIATKGAIIPAAVGVDIGCGMMAGLTNLSASDLPDSLLTLRQQIERDVPHGRTNNGKPGDRGAWFNVPKDVEAAWAGLSGEFNFIFENHKRIGKGNTYEHLGTLGTGNHFIEVCLDEKQRVWVMLHSGSRGVGNRIGSYFIEKAKEDMIKQGISVPDVDLSYLTENTENFTDYVTGVRWAQDFAQLNRKLMFNKVLDGMSKVLGRRVECSGEVVSCHHNYVEFLEERMITRKGAVSARLGQLGIIPGSMGAKSYIVRGKGNEESFNSCSHGAGRRMSRGQAKKVITLEQHIDDTLGVECRKDESVLDESPRAYKSIDAVMEAQKDLVDVVETLHGVLCVKG